MLSRAAAKRRPSIIAPTWCRWPAKLTTKPSKKDRIEIREGDAASLPYPDGTFTCAVMTGVFGFISNPVEVLSEIRRVLAPGGRFVLFTGTKKLLGTPAAPEPMASRLYFYEGQ